MRQVQGLLALLPRLDRRTPGRGSQPEGPEALGHRLPGARHSPGVGGMTGAIRAEHDLLPVWATVPVTRGLGDWPLHPGSRVGSEFSLLGKELQPLSPERLPVPGTGLGFTRMALFHPTAPAPGDGKCCCSHLTERKRRPRELA